MTDIVTKNPSMGLKLSTLLVIDDEPNVRYSLRQSLEDANLRVVTADNARHGLDAIELEQPDAVLLDVRLPDMSGLDLFCKIHELRPQLPVVVITAHGTTDTAIEATKRGAFDYLLKPFELPRLRAVVQRALEASRLARDAQSIADGNPESVDDLIVGQSLAMQEVYKAIGRVAPTNLNVLLLGESGTGKGVVAQTIYQHSRRSHRPFLRINCAAFPDDLLESELFGYERGAFSGAENRHVGRFEQAAGGTIFLDEIGDMSPATQAKVLRLLQEQQFERIGGNDTIRSDVRVIAATNQNLDDLTEAGKFRRDLYFRLKVYSVNLPPLRERLDDLPLLVSHFIRLHTGETVRSVRGVTDETLGLMKRYLWPGNVRELQSAVKYALVNATSEILTPETLPPNVAAGINLASRAEIVSPDHRPLTSFVRGLLETGDEDIYRKVIYLVDRLVLNEVLLTVGGNQVEASRRLGISRTTLRSKIHTQQLLDATSDAGAETEVPRQAADPSEGTS